MPTKLWPSLRASSWASITTLIAFSVKRSNIMRVTRMTLTPEERAAAETWRCTAAWRVALPLLPSPSTALARRKPEKATRCCCRLLERAPACVGPASTLWLAIVCMFAWAAGASATQPNPTGQ